MAFQYIRAEDIVTRELLEDIIVISPSLYWFAHAKFPTKSLSKAKKLADAYLSSRPVSYTDIYVEKKDDGFDCYAYNGKDIKERIDKSGLHGAPAYFLQQFSSQAPLAIDNDHIAGMINKIVVETKERNSSAVMIDALDFEAIAKPFNQKNELGFSQKTVIALLLLFGITALFDVGLHYQKFHLIDKKVESLQKGRSTYEIKSMITRYARTNMQQEKLRNAIRNALNAQHESLICKVDTGCAF